MATPLTSPVVPSMPLGTSMAMTGRFEALTASIRAASSPSIGAGEARAEQAVDHDIGAGEDVGG